MHQGDPAGSLPRGPLLVLAELSKSLPGTPVTKLLALLGQRIGGVRGGVVAAAAFLLPSTVLMIACGAAYSLVRATAGLSLFFARAATWGSPSCAACCWPPVSSQSRSWP